MALLQEDGQKKRAKENKEEPPGDDSGWRHGKNDVRVGLS